MVRTKPWLAMSLALLAYGVIFVVRKELHLLTWSGAMDWLVLVLCAAVPAFIHSDRSVPYRVGLFLVTALAEIGATILLMLTLYLDLF